MKQVTKEEFYKAIGAGNTHMTIINSKYPYTGEWRDHSRAGRPVVGKTVGKVERGVHSTDYFLSEVAE